MKQLLPAVRRFLQDDSDGDPIEYALIVALVALGAVVGTRAFGVHAGMALGRVVREILSAL